LFFLVFSLKRELVKLVVPLLLLFELSFGSE
jgi:hypothetical protein